MDHKQFFENLDRASEYNGEDNLWSSFTIFFCTTVLILVAFYLTVSACLIYPFVVMPIAIVLCVSRLVYAGFKGK